MLETVYLLAYTLRDAAEVHAIVRDCMENYEADFYRAEIQELGLEAVLESEWEAGWLPDNTGRTYATRAAAERARTEIHEDSHRYKIIEVSIEDVKTALLEEFGPDTEE